MAQDEPNTEPFELAALAVRRMGRAAAASISSRKAASCFCPMPITASTPTRTASRLASASIRILAAVHFVWGLVGTFIGFYRPRYATAFVLAFAAFYTVLAVLGSFTPIISA